MTSSPPFLDLETRTFDVGQIRREAFPLAALIALFGGMALLPALLVFFIAGNSTLGFLLTIVAQFILAIGTGIVLMYVIARAIQLAET